MSRTVICKNCGAPLNPSPIQDTRFCQNCGAVVEIDRTATTTTLHLKERRKVVLLSALVGIVLMGLGHFYVHRVKRGLLFMIVGLMIEIFFFIAFFGAFFSLSPSLTIIFGLVWLMIWALQVRDSVALVGGYNQFLKDSGRPPW